MWVSYFPFGMEFYESLGPLNDDSYSMNKNLYTKATCVYPVDDSNCESIKFLSMEFLFKSG